MPEKDYKKMEEKAGQETVMTTQTTPDMSLVINALTEVFGTFQKNLEATPPVPPEPPPFDGNAKIAVERFNDILAGLQLKPPLNPPLFAKDTVSATEIGLKWTIADPAVSPSGFKIMRATGANSQDFADVSGQLSAGTRTYLDQNLISKTLYRYRVVAFTSRGEVVSDILDITTL